MIVCSPQLGIAPKTVLGGEVCDREILLGLARKGIKVEILLPKGKPHPQNIVNWNITFIPIPHSFALTYNLIFLPFIISVYKKTKFDILRIHSPRYVGLGGLLFKFFNPKVKIVAYYHNFWETNFWFFSKFINSHWDFIICDSQNVREKIIKKFDVAPNKTAVAYNGVQKYMKPQPKNQNLIDQLGLKDKKILLFAGLLIDRKNPLFLLDVLKKLIKDYPNLVLIYLGQGNLKKDLLQKAKKLNILENIRIIGPFFDNEKNEVFNLADIFLHPAKEEGFAITPLEAMAVGKPVLITNSFSAKEMVKDGFNGFCCKPEDVENWSRNIKKLINKPELLKKLGQNSLNRINNEFSWEKCIDVHLKSFQKILTT